MACQTEPVIFDATLHGGGSNASRRRTPPAQTARLTVSTTSVATLCQTSTHRLGPECQCLHGTGAPRCLRATLKFGARGRTTPSSSILDLHDHESSSFSATCITILLVLLPPPISHGWPCFWPTLIRNQSPRPTTPKPIQQLIPHSCITSPPQWP